MPKIEPYQRKQSIPGEGANVPMNIDIAGAGGRALQGIGDTGKKAAESVMDFRNAVQRAERAVLAQRFEQELKDGIDEALISFENDGNWQGYDEKVGNTVKTLREKHVDTIQDPVLKQSAEIYFMGQSRNFERTIRRQKLALMSQESQARFDTDYNEALKNYVYETDPNLKDLTKKEIELKGFELEQRKLMKPGTTEKKMQKFEQDAEEFYIKQKMNDDPKGLAQDLRDYSKFKYIDPEKREEFIYRAEEQAYRKDIRKDRELNLARKEIHDTNGKEAFDRYKLWKKGGRAQDGVPFEHWLEHNRSLDNIGENTYEHYSNKIERAKDRAVTGGDKWTVSKRIQFGQIKQKFLDPEKDYSWSDIPDLTKGMPQSAAEELIDILVAKPSKERREALRVAESFINKKLKEAEASPETWESTLMQWKARSKEASVDNLQKIANEITGELPQGGLAAMMEEIKKKKGMKQEENRPKIGPKQTQAATTPKSGFTYNPITGEFKESKQ